MQAHTLRAQGATEYLVLLAIVLIVAMVTIALLGFMPGMSFEARQTEAKLYWSAMKPFQIPAHHLRAGSVDLTLVISNMEPDLVLIKNISVSGNGVTGSLPSPVYISGGEKKSVNVTLTNVACIDDDQYEYEVIITYFNEDKKISSTQYGAKSLVGRCTATPGGSGVTDPPSDPDPPVDDYCGSINEGCCAGTACDAGGVCRFGVCECGNFFQPCCSGYSCNGAMTCVLGTCI